MLNGTSLTPTATPSPRDVTWQSAPANSSLRGLAKHKATGIVGHLLTWVSVSLSAWNALEEEYTALHALLDARKAAGLTQETLAQRMGTTKSAVSRLEASLRDERHSPSFATLKKYANAWWSSWFGS